MPPSSDIPKPAIPTTTNPVVHKVMQANKRANTKPEQVVRALLREMGYPGYRLQWKKCPGHPDIAYPGRKIAIFVNGCFWHRCPICNMPVPKINLPYWEAKFTRNVERDARTRQTLEEQGWTVVNIWEHELKKERIQYTERYLYEVISLDDPQARFTVIGEKEEREAAEALRHQQVKKCCQVLKEAGIPFQQFKHKALSNLQQLKRLEKRMDAVMTTGILAPAQCPKTLLVTPWKDCFQEENQLKDQNQCFDMEQQLHSKDSHGENESYVFEAVSPLQLLENPTLKIKIGESLQQAEALAFPNFLNTVSVRISTSDLERAFNALRAAAQKNDA